MEATHRGPDDPVPRPSTPTGPHRHGGCRTGHRPPAARPLVSAPSRVERAAPDPDVVALLGTLSRDAFLADLETLAAHHTRRSESTGFDEVATWAQTALADAGYTVTTQPVPRGGGHCRNVIADRPGSGAEPRDVVLVTAHLDSINLSRPRRARARAPTTTARAAPGLLALARALAGRPTARDLRLILFGGEEEGLFGSVTYVAALPDDERARIRAVLNMDMIGGRNTPEPGVLLEGAAVSQDVIDALARAAATYTDLAVTTSLHPFNSDHVPFIDAGHPGGADHRGRRQREHPPAHGRRHGGGRGPGPARWRSCG